MPEFVRVRDKETGHEYSVVASAVMPDAHEVLKEKAGEGSDGHAAPPKYRNTTPPASVGTPESPSSKSGKPAAPSGQKAESDKEIS